MLWPVWRGKRTDNDFVQSHTQVIYAYLLYFRSYYGKCNKSSEYYLRQYYTLCVMKMFNCECLSVHVSGIVSRRYIGVLVLSCLFARRCLLEIHSVLLPCQVSLRLFVIRGFPTAGYLIRRTFHCCAWCYICYIFMSGTTIATIAVKVLEAIHWAGGVMIVDGWYYASFIKSPEEHLTRCEERAAYTAVAAR